MNEILEKANIERKDVEFDRENYLAYYKHLSYVKPHEEKAIKKGDWLAYKNIKVIYK